MKKRDEEEGRRRGTKKRDEEEIRKRETKWEDMGIFTSEVCQNRYMIMRKTDEFF